MDARLTDDERRVRRLEEEVQQIGDGQGECDSHYSGKVLQCGVAVSGATVVVKDHDTGVTLSTVTTGSDGRYSGTVTIVGGALVDVVATKGSFSNTLSAQDLPCGESAFDDHAFVDLSVPSVAHFAGQIGPCSYDKPNGSVRAGIPITIKNHATGDVVWSGETDVFGKYSGDIDIPAGSAATPALDFTLADPVWGTKTLNNQFLHCGPQSTLSAAFPPAEVYFDISGCGTAETVVTVSGPGGGGTASSLSGPFRFGHLMVSGPTVGTYTVTATKDRHVTKTFTITLNNSCVGQRVFPIGLENDPSYPACCLAGYPTPTTIHATGMGGETTLDYAEHDGPGTGYYYKSPQFTIHWPDPDPYDCCTNPYQGDVPAWLRFCSWPPWGEGFLFVGFNQCPVDPASVFEGTVTGFNCNIYTCSFGLYDAGAPTGPLNMTMSADIIMFTGRPAPHDICHKKFSFLLTE